MFLPDKARDAIAKQLQQSLSHHTREQHNVCVLMTDEIARAVADDLVDQPYCLQCGGCGIADCCQPCPYVDQYQGSYKEISAQLGAICDIVDELFAHIAAKYGCEVPAGLTCPTHQRLWAAVHDVELAETTRESEMRALLEMIAGSDRTGGAPTIVTEAQLLMARYRSEDLERTYTELDPKPTVEQNPEGPQG